MGGDDPIDDDSRPTWTIDPMALARDRFLAELRSGAPPRIEDYLDDEGPSIRPRLLRELIIAERDWRREHGPAADSADYLARFPGDAGLIDELLGQSQPTVTLSGRDRGEAEACLLFGLLAVARGLIDPPALTLALEAWAGSRDRPLREILVGKGYLDGSDASMIAGLVANHLVEHHGIARERLIVMAGELRPRIDPDGLVESEIRAALRGLDADPFGGRPSRGPAGLGRRYEIIKLHAKGGLGVVSLARDREIHREVALKEIRDDCADNPDYRARFLREAEVTGRLEHPGIVPVYGIGHHDDGRPYYIMRFIRGETLRAAIHRLHKPGGVGEEVGRGDPAGLHSLVGRFSDACHAVAYAHHRKILHRDLKPINIMLGPFGETLVVDWGLAKSFDGSRSGEYPISNEEGTLRPESGSGLTPTRYGSEVGTPGYMSPEQAEGRLTELGPTSDIYSLGVTLHYLATGHAPFEGLGKAEFRRRVREGDFPMPTKVNPSVPPALEAICLKAMALRPADRYQTATELVDDLQRWMAGNPVHAYPEPPLDRLARWSKRHKPVLAGAAVLLACTTIGLAAYAAKEREDNRKLVVQRDRANKQQAMKDAQLRATLKSLRTTLRLVEDADLAFLARSEPLRARMADDLVVSYRELSSGDPENKRVRFDLAQACRLAANIHRTMGQFPASRELYGESARLLESLRAWDAWPDDTRIELATLHNDAGENYRMVGKPKEAVAQYEKGLETLLRPTNPTRGAAEDSRIEARLQLDLCSADADLGRLDLAEAASRRAIDLLESRKDGPAPDRTGRLLLIYATLGRGSILRLKKEFDASSGQLAEADRLARQLLAAVSDPDTRFAVAAVRNEQGLLLIEAEPDGPRDAALIAFQEAYSHLEPICASLPRMIEFQRGIAVTLNGRGTCHLDMKKPRQARADFSEAWRLLERLNGTIPDHFHQLGLLGWTFANLSRTSRAEGDPEARHLLQMAVDYHRRALNLNPDSPVDRRLRDEGDRQLAKLEATAASFPPRP